jgi:hypothetical protein
LNQDEGIYPESLRHQLQVIRRRLWILNATLGTLPAKIERASREEGGGAFRHDGRGPAPPEPGNGLGAGRLIGGWRARWKLARLESRAERAERRAAVAINNASASLAAALGRVRHAAVARRKADEARLSRSRGPDP